MNYTRSVLKAAPTDEETEELAGVSASRPGLESQDHQTPSVLRHTSLRLGPLCFFHEGSLTAEDRQDLPASALTVLASTPLAYSRIF